MAVGAVSDSDAALASNGAPFASREVRARRAVALARYSAAGMIAALLVQFVLGMYINLYVPASSIVDRPSSDPLALLLHMVLAVLLVLGAIGSALGAAAAHRRLAVVMAGTGAAAIVFAGFGGLEFLATGHDVYSFVMAVGFATALASYASLAYFLR